MQRKLVHASGSPGEHGLNRIFRYAAPLTGLFLACLASCGPETPGNGGNAFAAAQPAAGNASTLAPAPAPQAREKDGQARIVLEGGGLRIVPAGGAARLVAFGMPAAATLDALTKALGRGPSRRGSNEECGGGAQTLAAWDGLLTLWFSKEEGFVGWDSGGRLATAEGIAIGSPRSALRALKGVKIAQSTLGTEFTAGDMSGLLASKAPDAKVEALWSGSTCVFR
jgi:hypothetical protein